MKDLTAQAKVLADRVGGLSTAVEHLDRRTQRSEKVAVGLAIGLVLELILFAVMTFILVQFHETDAQVNAAVEREAHTRQDSLCPLYNVFLGSYNPEARAEGEARDTYIRQFDVIRQAYNALDCKSPPEQIVPRATPR